MDGIEFIEYYKRNYDNFLPMINRCEEQFRKREQSGKENLGWNCGALGFRPYFVQLWKVSDVIGMTLYISTLGIDSYTFKDLEDLIKRGCVLFLGSEGYIFSEDIPKITDFNQNEFYSIDIFINDDNEPDMIWPTMKYYPYSILNRYNTNIHMGDKRYYEYSA